MILAAFLDFQRHGKRQENNVLFQLTMWSFAQKHPMELSDLSTFLSESKTIVSIPRCKQSFEDILDGLVIPIGFEVITKDWLCLPSGDHFVKLAMKLLEENRGAPEPRARAPLTAIPSVIL